jgi:hypothetical protein
MPKFQKCHKIYEREVVVARNNNKLKLCFDFAPFSDSLASVSEKGEYAKNFLL